MGETSEATEQPDAGGPPTDAAAAAAAEEIEKLTRAVNRRKQALGKLKAGGPSGVSERSCSKLLRRAQRRKRKFLADQARRAGKKPAEA
jgi:hypothetical protein